MPTKRQRRHPLASDANVLSAPVGEGNTSPRQVWRKLAPNNIARSHLSDRKELLNLRLLHHYTVHTAPSIGDALQLNHRGQALLQVDLPNLAFQHGFLLDVILFVAIVHLSSSDSANLPTVLYRDSALRGLRQEVAAMSSQNRRALTAASHLLGTVSFAADRVLEYPGLWVTNWLALGRGTQSFQTSPETSAFRQRHDSDKAPVLAAGHFDDLPVPATMPQDLERLLLIHEGDHDWIHRHVLFEAAAGIVNIIGSLALPIHKRWTEYKVMAWAFSLVSSEFVAMVRQGRPRALVILAYYLVLLNVMPRSWLFEGVASHDMAQLEKMVSGDWQKYLDIPRAALRFGDKVSLTEFLVGHLPTMSNIEPSLCRPFFSSQRPCRTDCREKSESTVHDGSM
jgi:hypothetical protein